MEMANIITMLRQLLEAIWPDENQAFNAILLTCWNVDAIHMNNYIQLTNVVYTSICLISYR